MIIDAKAEPRAGAQSADPPPIYSGPPPSRPAEGSQSSYRSQPPSHPDLVRQGPDRSVPMMVSRPDDAELGMRYHHQCEQSFVTYPTLNIMSVANPSCG